MTSPADEAPSGRTAHPFARILDRLVITFAAMGAFAVVFMMLHVALDVASRATFNAPIAGTLTVVTHYYMLILAFAPLALAERTRTHISVEVLMTLMPARVRPNLQGWANLFAATVLSVIAWRGGVEAIRGLELGVTQLQGSTPIPTWPAYFALPIGAGLWAMVLLRGFGAYLFLYCREADNRKPPR